MKMIPHVFTEYVDIESGKKVLDQLQMESPNKISIKFIAKQPAETVKTLSEYAKLLWPIDGQLTIL